jgi:hypothetical protein
MLRGHKRGVKMFAGLETVLLNPSRVKIRRFESAQESWQRAAGSGQLLSICTAWYCMLTHMLRPDRLVSTCCYARVN